MESNELVQTNNLTSLTVTCDRKAKKKSKTKKSKEEACPADLLENIDSLKISEGDYKALSANNVSKRKILGDINGRDRKGTANLHKKQPVVSVNSLSKKLGQLSITDFITVNTNKEKCSSSQNTEVTGEEEKALCKHLETRTFSSVLEEWDNLADIDDDDLDLSAVIQNIVSG